MFQKNNRLLIAGILLALFISSVCFAKLQTDYFGPNAPTEQTQLPAYIAYLYNAAIILCCLLALWSLIAGGFAYFTSQGSASKIAQAKDQIFSAFLGLIILLGSWYILMIINPSLAELKLPIPNIEKPSLYQPKEKPNESSYLVIPLGQFLENNFYSKKALEKIGKQTADISNISKSFNSIKSLLLDLGNTMKLCKCGDCQCSGNCPCTGSCPNAICDTQKIEGLKNKISQEINTLNEESQKLQGDENIFTTIKTMGTLMSLAENKNVDSYYTFLGGKNLLEGSATKLVESCDPFEQWDAYWQENKADPITFYLGRAANKKLISDVVNGNIDLEKIEISGTKTKTLEKKESGEDESEETPSGKFEAKGWMPIGELMLEVVKTTKDTNDAINKIQENIPKIVGIANSIINVASSCQKTDVCRNNCKEVYDSNGGCSCSGTICSPEYLCDISSLDSLLEQANLISSDFESGKSDFTKILSANIVPPEYLKDLYGTDFVDLSDTSHVYTSYKEFYKNFNELISPILSELGQDVTLPKNNGEAIPFIEFVKRQSDYSRIGFVNCQTAVGTEEDVQNIADGKNIYKYPYRVDFILTNQISVPINPEEANLNYYCASTQGMYSP